MGICGSKPKCPGYFPKSGFMKSRCVQLTGNNEYCKFCQSFIPYRDIAKSINNLMTNGIKLF